MTNKEKLLLKELVSSIPNGFQKMLLSEKSHFFEFLHVLVLAEIKSEEVGFDNDEISLVVKGIALRDYLEKLREKREFVIQYLVDENILKPVPKKFLIFKIGSTLKVNPSSKEPSETIESIIDKYFIKTALVETDTEKYLLSFLNTNILNDVDYQELNPFYQDV